MLKIYTQEAIIAERKEKSKIVRAYAFNDKAKDAAASMAAPARIWTSSKSSAEIMDELQSDRTRITNMAQPPSAADIEAFFGKLFIEIQRRAVESPDLTSMIAQEITNFEFPENPTLRDVLPFRGIMGVIDGSGDGVPLIQQNTGETDTITMVMRAIGWKDSINNMLYNKFFSMDKVVQAAVNAYIDMRNAATAGVMIGATYVASQQQAADATAGLTIDQLTYQTLLAANKKIRALKDIQTGRKIAVPSLSLLVNSADTWQISNVIRGQLNDIGAGATGNNMPALPIANIIEYDHGINDGFTIGKKVASFPGVTQGKCYLFVPGAQIVANKRPLTMESGRGSVLELSTEERAWYSVQAEYNKALLGSSYPATSIGEGFGNVVEVTLPS